MSGNNFHNPKEISQALFRMFLVYKPGYYTSSLAEAQESGIHHAYAGGKKYVHSFFNDKDGNGLVNRNAKAHAGHYKLCWLYDNQQKDGPVLRAWDEWGNELAPREVAQLNFRLKLKKSRQNNNVPTK